MQLLATLCTSMPTVRRTSLRRRVFWCRVKPGGGYENDLYYLEVCALNELCGNDEEICRAEVGGDVPVQSGRGEVGSRRGARRT